MKFCVKVIKMAFYLLHVSVLVIDFTTKKGET